MDTETKQTAAKKARTKGETKVWLTALGLSTGLIMVFGLLALIAVNGIMVFWPKPVMEITMVKEDGSTAKLAGEVVKTQIKRSVGDVSIKREVQYFTGNKDLYQLGFRFVDEEAIQTRDFPKDLIVAERMEYGDAIYYPESLELADGTKIAASDAAFEEKLAELVKEGNERRDEILHIEKGKIGKINAKMRTEELKIRDLEKNDSLDDAAKQERVGKVRDRIAELQADYEGLAGHATALRQEQLTASISYRISSGETKAQPVSEIVYYYYPNRMGWFGRLGVFFHHIWEFVSEEPREANTEGGIFPAIFGTFVMTLLMAVMVTPFGVIAAIYLREYAAQGLLVRTVRICVNNLAGVPSIVFGVFGLGFFVYGVGSFIDGGSKLPIPPVWWFLSGLGFIVSAAVAVVMAARYGGSAPIHGGQSPFIRYGKPCFSILAVLLGLVTLIKNPYFGGFFSSSLPTPTFGTGGIMWASLTLALMTLPVVIVATEEALAAVPRGVREAALACGASKWQMIQRVVLPSALPGVMTGVILAMARGAGEVAPLMITGVVKLAPSLPLDFTAPFIHAERKFMHLGFHIYDLGFQSPDSEAAKPMVFATTVLLILLVVVMNLAAINLRTTLKKKYQASAF